MTNAARPVKTDFNQFPKLPLKPLDSHPAIVYTESITKAAAAPPERSSEMPCEVCETLTRNLDGCEDCYEFEAICRSCLKEHQESGACEGS